MIIKSTVSNDLAIAKLCYFSYIARLLQLLFRLYQTDQPMLSFLFDNLKGLVKTLLANIINPSVHEKSKAVWELLDIKLDDQKILKFKSNYKRTSWPLIKFVHLKGKQEILLLVL